MKKLLPIIIALVGLVGGVGAGAFLQPAPEEPLDMPACEIGDADCEAKMKAQAQAMKPKPMPDPDQEWEYARLPKQFVVPIIKKEKVRALVVLSLSLEVMPGSTETVLARKPKLRDVFLQVMFKHANSGGFDGAFTGGQPMKDLRGSLTEVAQEYLGEAVNEVLIEEIVKQSM